MILGASALGSTPLGSGVPLIQAPVRGELRSKLVTHPLMGGHMSISTLFDGRIEAGALLGRMDTDPSLDGDVNTSPGLHGDIFTRH